MTEFQAFLALLFVGSIWLYGTTILKYIVNKGGAHLYTLILCLVCSYFRLETLGFFLGFLTYLFWPMKELKNIP